jgi:hypothetical protein
MLSKVVGIVKSHKTIGVNVQAVAVLIVARDNLAQPQCHPEQNAGPSCRGPLHFAQVKQASS